MALTIDEVERLMPHASIALAVDPTSRDDLIRRAAGLLAEAGSVTGEYADWMLERERDVSTFVGEGVAMPHGTRGAAECIRVEGLCLLQLTGPVDWAGQSVTLVIGIAAAGRRNIALLSQLALALLDDGRADALRGATTPGEVQRLLAG